MPHALPRKLFAFAATTPFALGLAIAVGPTSTAEAGSSDYSCPSGQTMQRSGSGVYCLKKGSVRSNRPTCGIRRYKIDGSGTTDWCTDTRGRRTGYPTCKTGGKKRSVSGADQCIDESPGKTTRPS